MNTQKQPLIIAIIVTLIFCVVTVTGFFVVSVSPSSATGAGDSRYPEVPAPANIVAPQKVDGLVYNGRPQALITAGQDDITYSLDKTNFSTSIPTAVHAGVYYVYYKIAGDDMVYNLYNTIAKRARTVSVTMANWNYDQTASQPVVTLWETDSTTVPVVTYYQDGQKLRDKPTAVGQYTVQITVPESTNYQACATTQDFAITSKIDLTFGADLQARYQTVVVTLGTQTQTIDLTYSRTTIFNALSGEQTLTVTADGKEIFRQVINAGQNQQIMVKG